MSHLLEVNGLTTAFTGDYGKTVSVDHVDFYVDEGEVVCIVGESGCGKSVTSLSIMGLLGRGGAVIDGSVLFDGKNLLEMGEKELDEIRGNRITMIFQDPLTSLNPVFTVGNQITESIRKHLHLSKEEAAKRAESVLEKVGMPDAHAAMKKYPHTLSGGMRQRAMIAMALCCNPALLIADEPTTALDVTIQAQILDLIREMNEELHSSVLFITHDLGVVSELCDTVIVMYTGHIVEQAPAGELFRDPKHPYTIGLLNAIPVITKDRKPLSTIEGMVPNPTERIKGCSFWPRCPHATERCRTVSPPMKQLSEERKVRCWLFEDQAAGKEA